MPLPADAGTRRLPADDLGPAVRNARVRDGDRRPRRAPPDAREAAGREAAGRGGRMPGQADCGAWRAGNRDLLPGRRPRCLRCAGLRRGTRTGIPDRLQLRQRHQHAAGRQPLPAAAHAGRDQRRPGLVQGHPRGARTVLASDQTEGISIVMLCLLTWLGLVLIRPQEYPALVDLAIPILPIAMLGALGAWAVHRERRPLNNPTYLLFVAFIAVGIVMVVPKGWVGGALSPFYLFIPSHFALVFGAQAPTSTNNYL